ADRIDGAMIGLWRAMRVSGAWTRFYVGMRHAAGSGYGQWNRFRNRACFSRGLRGWPRCDPIRFAVGVPRHAAVTGGTVAQPASRGSDRPGGNAGPVVATALQGQLETVLENQIAAIPLVDEHAPGRPVVADEARRTNRQPLRVAADRRSEFAQGGYG